MPESRELGGREARDHGEVARHKREDAGGEEGEDPCPEGDQDADGVGRNCSGQKERWSPPFL